MNVFGWLMGSALTAFVFIAIPFVMIGASSGFILGQARGGMSGASALWCAVLGPAGWIITLFATRSALTNDEVRTGVASAVAAISSRVGAGQEEDWNEDEY